MTPQTGRRRGLWDKPLYPHFEISDAAAMVEKARKAGYRIVQEPRKFDFGAEAFIADPDGYTWGVCISAEGRFRPLKQPVA